MALRIEKRKAEFARKMRREPTEPEKRLWYRLSNSQIGGFKFRRQSVIGTYICDFSCSYNGLIVELDGMTHDEHSDIERDAMLSRMGYTVIRFTNQEVMQNMDGVLTRILEVAERLPQRRYTPTPNPSLGREGNSQ
jgi:very-short-patch-repair endonuclease